MTEIISTSEPTQRFHVHLEDFHPGEYTPWQTSNDRWPTDKSRSDLSRWYSYPNLEITFCEFDPDLDEGNEIDYWDILGDDFRSMVAPLNDLITNLAQPIWDWYGLGGDDNTYDYWPNSMTLALEYLNQLRSIASTLPTPGEREDLERYAATNLNRVYWLTRMRFSRGVMTMDPIPDDNPIDRYFEDADGYFNDDILNSEGFGEKPKWIP